MQYTIPDGNGGRYVLQFRNTKDHRELIVIPPKTNLFRCERACMCMVSYHNQTTTELGLGVSFQSKLDMWDSEKGRKLALKQALVHVPKAARGKLWEYYLTHKPDRQHKRGVQIVMGTALIPAPTTV
jgi:hypothetical protein